MFATYACMVSNCHYVADTAGNLHHHYGMCHIRPSFGFFNSTSQTIAYRQRTDTPFSNQVQRPIPSLLDYRPPLRASLCTNTAENRLNACRRQQLEGATAEQCDMDMDILRRGEQGMHLTRRELKRFKLLTTPPALNTTGNRQPLKEIQCSTNVLAGTKTHSNSFSAASSIPKPETLVSSTPKTKSSALRNRLKFAAKKHARLLHAARRRQVISPIEMNSTASSMPLSSSSLDNLDAVDYKSVNKSSALSPTNLLQGSIENENDFYCELPDLYPDSPIDWSWPTD